MILHSDLRNAAYKGFQLWIADDGRHAQGLSEDLKEMAGAIVGLMVR